MKLKIILSIIWFALKAWLRPKSADAQIRKKRKEIREIQKKIADRKHPITIGEYNRLDARVRELNQEIADLKR